MMALKTFLTVLVGLASGTAVAGGIFAFIAVIGIVPRVAQKTNTMPYIPVYEDFITVGGFWGASTLYLQYRLPFGPVFLALAGLAIGVFVGCLAISLAEVLNVMPVFARRARLTKGLSLLILALALGKMTGSLLYFLAPGFYNAL